MLLVLLDLSLMVENLQCFMVYSAHGDCGIMSEVSLTGAQAQLGTLCLGKEIPYDWPF